MNNNIGNEQNKLRKPRIVVNIKKRKKAAPEYGENEKNLLINVIIALKCKHSSHSTYCFSQIFI